MGFQLRPYRREDEDAAISLWQQTWQQAYPGIDFAARVTGGQADRVRHHRRIRLSRSAGRRPRSLGFVARQHAGRGSKASVARPHHAIGQHRQCPRHPLLRTQRLCACRRGRESYIRAAGAADGVEGKVKSSLSGSTRQSILERSSRRWIPGFQSGHDAFNSSHTPSNCNLASRA